MRPSLSLLVLLLAGPGLAAPLAFSMDAPGVANRFRRDERGTVHLLASARPRPRVILAFPEGNAGVGLWMTAPGGAEAEVRVLAGPVTGPLPGDDHAPPRGAWVELEVAAPEVRLEHLRLGSIRTLRDLAVSGREARVPVVAAARDELARHPSLAHLTGRLDAWLAPPRRARPGLVLDRPTLDGRHRLRAVLQPRGTTRLEGSGAEGLRLVGRGTCRFRLAATHDMPRLEPFPPEELLSKEAGELLRRLALEEPPAARRLQAELEALSFLLYRDRVLAGSWRFLTYFGRDTLLTLRLMAPVLSEQVLTAGLGSVLARLSPEGAVAHEEDVGDQAAFARLARLGGDPATRDRVLLEMLERRDLPGEVELDYKMVDDDLLLPGLALDVLRRLEAPARQRFLDAHPGEGPATARTHRELLLSNLRLVTRELGRDLIPLKEGLEVGDWRDSNDGLGGGRYSFEVACLMDTAEHACRELLGSGWLGTGPGEPAAAALAALKPRAPRHRAFRVTLPAAEVRRRLGAFLAAADPEERRWMRSRPLPDGSTLGAFLDGGPSPFGPTLRFHAVSLDARRHPVPVMNTDVTFLLLDLPDARLGTEELREVLEVLALPWPLGLWTEAGPLVASAALSGDPALWRRFDRRQYHGAVVWGWQLAMLEAAFLRHHEGAADSPWARLFAAGQEVRRRLGALAAEELWTWRVRDGALEAAPYGLEADAATESNALQLWSHVGLSNQLLLWRRLLEARRPRSRDQ